MLNVRSDDASNGVHFGKHEAVGVRQPTTTVFDVPMSSEESDQMMAFPQELSALKELDAAFEDNPNESERQEYQLRQQRREEIGLEMKRLAEQKKNAEQSVAES